MASPSWRERAALITVIAAATLLAAAWALYLPMFQGADENEHFEYVVAIYAAGRPLSGGETSIHLTPGRPLPDPAYLEDASGFSVIAGHPEIKAPIGYGSVQYFQQLDRLARQAESGYRLFHPRLLLVHTPVGYYAPAAAYLGLVALFLHSPSALFFASRFFNVLLLVPTLLLTYAVARELGIRRRRANVLTGVAGLLPVSTFVFSTVQPDALGAPLVLAATYAGLRHRTAPAELRWAVVFGVALGWLVVTKFQYWAVAALAVGAMVAVTRLRKRDLKLGRAAALMALAVAPSALIWIGQAYLFRHAPPIPIGNPAINVNLSSYAGLHKAVAEGPVHLAAFLGASLGYSLLDIFFTNTQHGFWGYVDWTDSPLRIGPPSIDLTIAALLWAATLVILPLGIWRLVNVLWRLLAVARRRGPLTALAVATANPAVNAYVLFTLLVLVLDVESGTTFDPQGRFWIPFLLGFVIFAVGSAPKALPWRRLARALSTLAFGGLVVYVVAAAAYELPSLHLRYYGSGREVAAVGATKASAQPGQYRLLLVSPLVIDPLSGPALLGPAGPNASVERGQQIGVAGWAVSPSDDAVARAVLVLVDGRPAKSAVYGDDPPAALPGPAPAHSGFDAILDTSGLESGLHEVAVEVIDSDGMAYGPAESLPLEIR